MTPTTKLLINAYRNVEIVNEINPGRNVMMVINLVMTDVQPTALLNQGLFVLGGVPLLKISAYPTHSNPSMIKP